MLRVASIEEKLGDTATQKKGIRSFRSIAGLHIHSEPSGSVHSDDPIHGKLRYEAHDLVAMRFV